MHEPPLKKMSQGGGLHVTPLKNMSKGDGVHGTLEKCQRMCKRRACKALHAVGKSGTGASGAIEEGMHGPCEI